MKKTVAIIFLSALLISCVSTKDYGRLTDKIQYMQKIDSLKSEIAQLKMKNTTDSLRLLLGFYKSKSAELNFEKHKTLLTYPEKPKVEGEQIKTPYIKVFADPNVTGTFKDERDGQTYKWVKIGNQIWMAQNMNYVTETGCWSYNDDASNRNKYGLLYNFYQIKLACPKGWHVPTEKEWAELEATIKSGTADLQSGTGNGYDANCLLSGNDSGFDILFAGIHRQGHNYSDLGQRAWFWTATRIDNPIHVRIVEKTTGRIKPSELGTAYSLSLRCVKDM
jgi:uncharacterized protein (TIGR02145 family)